MGENEELNKIIELATEKAKANLKNVIPETLLGYKVCLNSEIQKILKEEYNIDWEPMVNDSPSESID